MQEEKEQKPITKIIELHLINIGIGQEQERNKRFPEDEDADLIKEYSATAEDAVARETSRAVKTEIKDRILNFIHMELDQIDRW